MSFSITNKQAGPIGFGLLGLSRPPAVPYEEASKIMKAALDHGANFWDGGSYYGTPTANSLHLLKHYFTTYPSDSAKVILCIKGAFSYSGPDNSPSSIRKDIDNCLAILDGKASLDIFMPGRIDVNVPIEDTVRTLASYVKEGKIGGYGLSECSAATIRRAHAIHPLSVVEIELSLFATHTLTNGVAQTCAELGIAMVAYSPLSRGFLTGQITKLSDIPENDSRHHFPRFQPDVFNLNVKLVEEIRALAAKTGYSMPQVALAWVRAVGRKLGVPVIPIPGCTTVGRVEENMLRAEVEQADLEALDRLVEGMVVYGERYPEVFQKYSDL